MDVESIFSTWMQILFVIAIPGGVFLVYNRNPIRENKASGEEVLGYSTNSPPNILKASPSALSG